MAAHTWSWMPKCKQCSYLIACSVAGENINMATIHELLITKSAMWMYSTVLNNELFIVPVSQAPAPAPAPVPAPAAPVQPVGKCCDTY